MYFLIMRAFDVKIPFRQLNKPLSSSHTLMLTQTDAYWFSLVQ